jgi:hypothetical protein
MTPGLVRVWRRRPPFLAALLIVLAACSGSVAAQSRNATLRVTVVDPSGAVIVGAAPAVRRSRSSATGPRTDSVLLTISSARR